MKNIIALQKAFDKRDKAQKEFLNTCSDESDEKEIFKCYMKYHQAHDNFIKLFAEYKGLTEPEDNRLKDDKEYKHAS